jgi:twitching motility protein PilT
MSIRPVDRFIRAMHAERGGELSFESGRPIRLLTRGAERVLLAQNVRTDQIETLVRNVMPAEIARRYEASGEVEFEYTAPSGKVSVELLKKDTRLSMKIKPESHAEAGAASDPVRTFLEEGSTDLKAIKAPAPPTLAKISPMPIPVVTASPVPEPMAPSPSVKPATPVKPAQAPITFTSAPKKIDAILRALVAEKGSDLHLTSNLPPKMRKDGDIGSIPGYEKALSSDELAAWLLEPAPANMVEKFAETNDADFAYEIPGVARFRVNVFRDRRGVGGVMRVIPSEIMTADQLKIPPVVRSLCNLQKGLVVVTGPTGSGKSTTLAAMVDLINKTRTDHIITIEDPVEFVHEPLRCLINQREVHSHTKSFSAALRAALREDPDIVLVGEMRDLETVAIAIETAETGHLVFGTLHTNTAVSTIDRVIDQFPTDRQSQVRVMLSESLKGVVAQTLCKKHGGGRIAALEILVVTAAVAALIRDGKTFQIASIMQTQKGIGMQTLNDALMLFVKDRLISPKEAYTKSVARGEMRQLLEKAGHVVG